MEGVGWSSYPGPRARGFEKLRSGPKKVDFRVSDTKIADPRCTAGAKCKAERSPPLRPAQILPALAGEIPNGRLREEEGREW